MALNRKYAALPDLDSAPDIYETPELTDDASTVPTTAARSQSDDEFYDVDDDAPGISRSRLRIEEARSRFLPAQVDAEKTDFSDRVDGKRNAYRASSRRSRILEDGSQELGDFSDEDNEESLDRRIARLKREVEEAKEAYTKVQAASSSAAPPEQKNERLESLSQVLETISTPLGIGERIAARKTHLLPSNSHPGAENPVGDGATYTVTYAPSYDQSHAMAKAASFDQRLSLLEKGLGIGPSATLEVGDKGLPRAVLPTLDVMEKQISTLAQASTSNLDAISRRVRTLASEQDKLNESREKAKALREELGQQTPAGASSESDQEVKINALYGTLPTIETLTPMLPTLLDRLRSLRSIHAGAAAASQTLERIEQQHADVYGELKQWTTGLGRLEEAIKERDTAIEGNMNTMETWVKDLEERMTKLAS